VCWRRVHISAQLLHSEGEAVSEDGMFWLWLAGQQLGYPDLVARVLSQKIRQETAFAAVADRAAYGQPRKDFVTCKLGEAFFPKTN
jgi:hypothetical protein